MSYFVRRIRRKALGALAQMVEELVRGAQPGADDLARVVHGEALGEPVGRALGPIEADAALAPPIQWWASSCATAKRALRVNTSS